MVFVESTQSQRHAARHEWLTEVMMQRHAACEFKRISATIADNLEVTPWLPYFLMLPANERTPSSTPYSDTHTLTRTLTLTSNVPQLCDPKQTIMKLHAEGPHRAQQDGCRVERLLLAHARSLSG